MKFEEYCKLDPRIHALYVEAITAGNGLGKYCAIETWYGYGPRVPHENGFKTRLVPLVGMMRDGGPEELGDSDAYDCCYQTILRAMPYCHGLNCGCQPDDDKLDEEDDDDL